MVLALSSFCNKLGAGLELLTLGCCFGLYMFLGLIGGDNGRLRANVRLFLRGWAATSWNICAISTTEFHMSNPLHVKCDASAQAREYFPVLWSRRSSLAEAGLQRAKLTHDETTAHKIKSCSEFVTECHEVFSQQINICVI